MAHHKLNLPEKICATCARPFAWRKKWARDWENVKFCSDACRVTRQSAAPTKDGGSGPGDVPSPARPKQHR